MSMQLPSLQAWICGHIFRESLPCSRWKGVWFPLQKVVKKSSTHLAPCQENSEQPENAKLPTFIENESYSSVRNKMIAAGWQPFHASDAGTCLKEDERCEGRPEMESCTGTGLGNCRFLWIKNGEKASISTIGDNAIFDGAYIIK